MRMLSAYLRLYSAITPATLARRQCRTKSLRHLSVRGSLSGLLKRGMLWPRCILMVLCGESRTKMSKSLYSAALFHHSQAQKYKDGEEYELATATYAKAAAAYGAYLEEYPHDKQLYELTFYLAECLYYSLDFATAAAKYRHVRDSNSDSKFFQDSALSVVLSLEKAAQVAVVEGELDDLKVFKNSEREVAELSPRPLPALREDFVAAADRYDQVVGDDEYMPAFLYKTAEFFYAYDQLEPAKERFRAIIERWPGHEVAEYATNLLIESHLIEEDFHAVEDLTRTVLAREDLQVDPDKADYLAGVLQVKTSAMFKIAEALSQANKLDEAATYYVKLVDEDPATPIADFALNNAAVAYEKRKRFDSAAKLYERLVRERPGSTLADEALFRVGLNAERFFNFDKAIKTYSALARDYPNSARRADSVYNAALAMENVQAYERAAKLYLRYCDLFPDRDDAPEVCFRAGGVYAKMGDKRRVIATYRNFIRRYRNDDRHRDRIADANLRVARAYRELKREKDALKYFDHTVKEFEANPKSESAPYAAEAKFNLIGPKFEDFQRYAISGRNTKQQKKQLIKKSTMLKEVEGAYKRVLGFKQLDWTLASLYRIGRLYQELAASILAAPCPSDIRRAARSMGMTAEEVCDEYKIVLEEQAVNVEDKAVLAFEITVNKAREFQIVNEWSERTLVQLNRLRREIWPLQKEAKSFIDPGVVEAAPMLKRDGSLAGPRSELQLAPADASGDGEGTKPTEAPESGAESSDSPVSPESATAIESPVVPGADQIAPSSATGGNEAASPDGNGDVETDNVPTPTLTPQPEGDS